MKCVIKAKMFYFGEEYLTRTDSDFTSFDWSSSLAVELPIGSFPCDGRCCLELFSNSLHQAIDLCTSHIDRPWHVRYVRNGTGFYH